MTGPQDDHRPAISRLAAAHEMGLDFQVAIARTAQGDLLAELHSVDAAEAHATGVEFRGPAEVRDAWRADIDHVAAEFDVAPHLSDRWAAWLDGDSFWPDWSVLTHGEIYPAHPLVVDSRITAVLDWTTASVSDPAKAFDLTVDRYVQRGGRVWHS